MADWEAAPSPASSLPAKTADGWESAPGAPAAAPPKQPGLLATALKPIAAVPGAIADEFREGKKQVGAGYDAFMKKNGGEIDTLSGALREMFAPITGIAKALVGDPLRANLPKNKVGEVIAQTGEDAAGMFGPAAVSKSLSAASKAFPKYNDAVQTLMKEGIRLTPGQIAQGVFKRAEDAIRSVPVIGDMIASGQSTSFKDFNRAVIDRSLAGVGEKLPKDIEMGRKAIAYADDALGRKYDALVPKLTMKLDSQFAADSAAIEANNLKMMPEAQQKQWAHIWTDIVDRADQAGIITGRSFKEIDSELSHVSRNYARSDDPAQRQFADAVDKVRAALRDNLERNNPKYADELQKLNSSWAAFARARGASVRRVKSNGVFSPGDLLGSIKQSSPQGVYARGDAMLQDLADAANEILPQAVPDSGTATRLLMSEAATGGAAAVLGHPGIAATILGAGIPYTGPGMSVINKAAKGLPSTASAANRGLAASGVPAVVNKKGDSGSADLMLKASPNAVPTAPKKTDKSESEYLGDAKFSQYPTSEEGRSPGVGYGTGNEGLFESGRATDATGLMGSTKDIFEKMTKSGKIESPKIADLYRRAAVAVNRNAIAALGFDPRVVGVENSGQALTVAGAYQPKSDQIFSSTEKPSNIVHESTHRGLEKVRQSGVLSSEERKFIDEHDEDIVRYIMVSNMGDPEKGDGNLGERDIGQRERAAAMKFFENSENVKMLMAVQKKAQDLFAKQRPGGPR